MQNTQTYNFIQKSFFYVLFCNSILMENFPKEMPLSGIWFLWYFCLTVPRLGRLFDGQQCFLEVQPSASSVPLPWEGRKDNGTNARWLPLSHIDLGSEKAIYSPSRGKRRVSRLQGTQQRCASADPVDNNQAPGCNTLWRQKAGSARHGILTKSPASKIKGK